MSNLTGNSNGTGFIRYRLRHQPDFFRTQAPQTGGGANAFAEIRLQDIRGPHKIRNETGLRTLIDSLRASHLHDTTLIEYCHPVAHGQSLALIVGNEHEGDPQLPLQRFQLHLHLLPQFQIQRPQGLIQQQYFGTIDQSPGQGHALALTTGQLPRLPVSELRQPHQFQHFGRLPAALLFTHATDHQTVGNVVHHVHVGEEGVVLKHGIDRTTIRRNTVHPLAKNGNVARSRLLKTRHQSQAGGLAGTGRPQHAEELALVNRQVDLVHRLDRAEVAAGPDQTDRYGPRHLKVRGWFPGTFCHSWGHRVLLHK